MRIWMKRNDIDYADVLMVGMAMLTGIPAATLVGYGLYSAMANGARLIASIF